MCVFIAMLVQLLKTAALVQTAQSMMSGGDAHASEGGVDVRGEQEAPLVIDDQEDCQVSTDESVNHGAAEPDPEAHGNVA